jgi:transmembrane sensor
MSPDLGDEIPWTLLDRYLAGECTPAERVRVRHWLAAHPVDAERIERLRTVLGPETKPSGLADPDTMWAAVRAARGGVRVRPKISHTAFIALGAGSLAAALAFLAVRVRVHPTAEPFQEFVSEIGSRTTITLRDGSRLILAPDSRVRVPGDFGDRTRTVELTGEAELSVVHNAKHLFVVRTSRAVIHDVGTTFVVRSYPDDATDRVAVEDGEVAVGRTVLVRGDLATVSDTALSVVHGAKLDGMVAWIQGGLSFQDVPLRTVARDVSRAYGVPVVVADSSLLDRHITGTFAGAPLDVVLEEITRALDARYTRTARGVVIARAAINPVSPNVSAKR